MNKNVKVTEKLFNAVKTLLNGGATYAEIKDYLGVGHSTVTRINHSETYDDYRQQMAAIAIEARGRYKAKEPEKPVEKPVEEKPVKSAQDWYISNRTLQALEEQNKLLKLISDKLAFIVEQLA